MSGAPAVRGQITASRTPCQVKTAFLEDYVIRRIHYMVLCMRRKDN